MSEEKKLKEVKRLANNALYFGSGVDYKSILYEILVVIAPEVFDKKGNSDFKYIEQISTTKMPNRW